MRHQEAGWGEYRIHHRNCRDMRLHFVFGLSGGGGTVMDDRNDAPSFSEVLPIAVLIVNAGFWLFAGVLSAVGQWAGEFQSVSMLPFISNALYCGIGFACLAAGYAFWRSGKLFEFWLSMFTAFAITYGM